MDPLLQELAINRPGINIYVTYCHVGCRNLQVEIWGRGKTGVFVFFTR